MTKLINRVKMTTGTVGTGTVTLNAAVSGAQSFNAGGALTNDIFPIVIEDGSAWEIGYGTYNSTGPTITRNLVQSSTGTLLSLSGNAKVSVSPSQRDVVVGMYNTAINFGTNPVYSATFTFAFPGVSTLQKIIMTPDSSVLGDELEMDGFACAAHVSATDTITAYINSIPGPVQGTKNFNFIVG